jgi:hypothetical protein
MFGDALRVLLTVIFGALQHTAKAAVHKAHSRNWIAAVELVEMMQVVVHKVEAAAAAVVTTEKRNQTSLLSHYGLDIHHG